MQRNEGVAGAGARNTDGSRGVHEHGQEVSVVTDGWDDEGLLAALRQALSERRAVPPEFVAAAKSAYTWRNIDAELAQLSYDSACQDAPMLAEAASMRAEAASIRALTFTSAHLSIALEVTEDSLLGQVFPAQAAVVEVQGHTDGETEILTDEIGCFTIRPIPRCPFRLSCRVAASLGMLTTWLTL